MYFCFDEFSKAKVHHKYDTRKDPTLQRLYKCFPIQEMDFTKTLQILVNLLIMNNKLQAVNYKVVPILCASFLIENFLVQAASSQRDGTLRLAGERGYLCWREVDLE